VIYRVFGALALLALIVGTVVLSGRNRAADVVDATDERSSNPGYSARDARVVETGPDGKPRYQLHADLITQAPRDLVVSLQNPVITYSASDGGLWKATADRGSLPQSVETISLEGNVRLRGTLGGAPKPVAFATERLQFDTRNEIASTDAAVSIEWSGQKIMSRGLRADLKQEQLQLESGVQGRFTR